MTEYVYDAVSADPAKLDQELTGSAYYMACVVSEGDPDAVPVVDPQVLVYTAQDLTEGVGSEKEALDALVAAHVNPGTKTLHIEALLPSQAKSTDVRGVDYKTGLTTRLHKVMTYFRGEVRQVDYYLDDTLADKVVTVEVFSDDQLTNLGYSRTANGLAVERWTKRTWWNTDGTEGETKTTHKKYDHDPIEQMREGSRRRSNVIQTLIIDVLNMLVVTTAVDPLNPTLAEIQAAEADGSAFMESYNDDISNYLRTGNLDFAGTPGIGNDSTAWLDTTFDGSPTIIAIAAAQGWTGTVRSMIQGQLVEINAP